MSPELERLFRHALALPGCDPPHVDDVFDLLDGTPDAELSRVCGAPCGPRAVGPRTPHGPMPSLTWSCELRRKLWDELADVYLALPDSSCGWVDELLGPGKRKARGRAV